MDTHQANNANERSFELDFIFTHEVLEIRHLLILNKFQTDRFLSF